MKNFANHFSRPEGRARKKWAKKSKTHEAFIKKGATSPQGFSFLTKGFYNNKWEFFWSLVTASLFIDRNSALPCYNLTNFYIDKKFKIAARKSAIWFRYSFSPVMGSLLNNLRLRRPGLEWDNLRPNHQEFQ